MIDAGISSTLFQVTSSKGRLRPGGSIERDVASGPVQFNGTGEFFHFQAWFRDVQITAQGPQPTRNFTDGIRLDF